MHDLWTAPGIPISDEGRVLCLMPGHCAEILIDEIKESARKKKVTI